MPHFTVEFSSLTEAPTYPDYASPRMEGKEKGKGNKKLLRL